MPALRAVKTPVIIGKRGRKPRPSHLPPYPRGLEWPEKRLWDKFTDAYGMTADDVAGLENLAQALHAHARARKAAELIAAEGMTIATETTVKAHPAIGVELQARALFCNILRRLGFDIEPPKAPGKRGPKSASEVWAREGRPAGRGDY